MEQSTCQQGLTGYNCNCLFQQLWSEQIEWNAQGCKSASWDSAINKMCEIKELICLDFNGEIYVILKNYEYESQGYLTFLWIRSFIRMLLSDIKCQWDILTWSIDN